jgi:hypothetical protein
MRVFKRVAVIGVLAGLVIGPVALTTSASAAPGGTRAAQWAHQVRLTGGDPSVPPAPGTPAALLGHGIVPVATLPGTEGARIGSGGVVVRFTFPVTGGWLNAAKLTGTIRHKGGILFADVPAGKQILVSDFVISVHQGVLTAEVNGNPKVRVPLLRLSLAHAAIASGRHYVRISGIVVTLTGAAASALNATFGTSLFKPGLELGTASTVLRF